MVNEGGEKKSSRILYCNITCCKRTVVSACASTVTVYRAIFLSPATYLRLHHRSSKVLLLDAQVRPDFSFYPLSVRS